MKYESTFIVSPELSAEKTDELITKIVKTIEALKGTIKAIQQLGKKRFAYSINKFREGNYIYMEFSGGGEIISTLENLFKFTDSVVRFLTIKIEKKKNVVKSDSKVEQSTADCNKI